MKRNAMKQNILKEFSPWPLTRLTLWFLISTVGFTYRAYYTNDQSVMSAALIPVIAFALTYGILAVAHWVYSALWKKP